ncbi:macrolide transport system ATP-binding/permease protein [Herbihabitans rhizosphaerae]|uniref:Macrolide transport system ATP-binding/permease protein n=1 Tax=Herbihabitans rhizosphaerae TaxID=1872711 RepID=A0A4Q7KMN6_9PSEU|nr:ABC-F family ATP-binding cassette domain-containing protein [Herbihabitans rhizosphaerae]RZS37547.1 macrolide transport system ATP-binding/permease protein [Herbihabitans rhizosphaerae]
MSTQITAHAVSKSYGDRLVLDQVGLALPVGERTGVIGENGSGKSTLIRLLAGVEQPDSGEITVAADGGIGYLPQHAQLPAYLTVRHVIDDALAELRAIEARLRELESSMDGNLDGGAELAEYGTLLTVFELRGGYDADARAERAMHGLGLDTLDRDRPLGTLSGGEQVRLRLAAVLAASPEVLLLDEPTNHLDGDALYWLEDHLVARKGTTVAVSHDRVFLERVASTLIEVDADTHTIPRYGNGYAGFLAEKAAARQRWAQAHERWQDEVDAQRAAVATTARNVAPGRAMTDRNKMAYGRAGNRVAKSVASRVRNAERRLRVLLDEPVPRPPEPLRFAPSLRAKAHGRLDAAGVAVRGRLEHTDVTVEPGGRLLITGPNGSGKSTLLEVLAGTLEPDAGTVTSRGRIGYLPQETAVHRPQETVLSAFARGRPGTREEHAERLLALGLFTGEALRVPVGKLSVGQRRRLGVARLLTEPADVLLLDEPTNHLSLGLVEELECALDDYPGALVVVSHDRGLINRWQKGNRCQTTEIAPSLSGVSPV